MKQNGNDRRAFEVVFVCSGNRFRSPLAEASLSQLTRGIPVRVTSVGTLDLGPKPVLSEALTLGRSLGLDLSEHRARALSGGSLEEADLVIGFERAHVSMAVVEAGARPERTFTMPELVELREELVDAHRHRLNVPRSRSLAGVNSRPRCGRSRWLDSGPGLADTFLAS